jgi:hypothetical protein
MRENIFIATMITLLLVVTHPASLFADRSQEGEGRGVNSQLLWPSAGPSHFMTVMSSDVAGHKTGAFSSFLNYHRKPLGLVTEDGEQWVVENALTMDFIWAFGIIDIFQVGLALPVVLEQNGVGMTPIQPEGTPDSDYMLAGSALGDIRLNFKARLLGGNAKIPDQRDFGLAIDLGVSLPSGDEMNFAGDGGVVLFPTLVADFHRCMFSAAVNLGGRFRFDQDISMADLSVGQQGTFGVAATGHFFKRRFLVSGEMTGIVEFDGFDRVGVEYRGALGYVLDQNRAITIWAGAGSAFGTGDLLGTPEVRAIVSLSYAPRKTDPSCCDYKY